MARTRRSGDVAWGTLLVALSAAGCGPPPPHAWTSPPDASAADATWEQLPESNVFRADDREDGGALRTKAAVRLETSAAVPLDGDPSFVAEILAANADGNGKAAARPLNGRPFLLRGVCSGGPVWARVWCDRASGTFWVHQGSWNGEMLLPDSPADSWPVLVFADTPPAKVTVTSVRGGDGIFRGTDRPTPPPLPERSATAVK